MNLVYTTNILDAIIKLQKYLSEDSLIELVDFLLPMTKQTNLNKDIRIKGLEYLKKLEKLPKGRINDVLTQIKHILKTEPQFKEYCLEVLEKFERYR